MVENNLPADGVHHPPVLFGIDPIPHKPITLSTGIMERRLKKKGGINCTAVTC